MALSKADKRTRIKKRIRKKISGTGSVPRLSVFRSNKEIYAQLIDDLTGTTLAAASSLKFSEAHGIPKVDQATVVGKKIAEAAAAKGIETCVFDRNGYQYHGRVKALAEAARENGLKF